MQPPDFPGPATVKPWGAGAISFASQDQLIALGCA